MRAHPFGFSRWRGIIAFLVFGLMGCIVYAGGQSTPIAVLRIGSTSTITGDPNSPKEKAGHETLRRFVKEETGLNNEITGSEKWDELTVLLAKGERHIGVFQGYEFAWAQQKDPHVKPLAVGINGYRYPVAFILAQKKNPARDLSGLKGQTCVVPTTGQTWLQLFVDRSCEALHEKADMFFSKLIPAENAEDALDDVVDGKAQAIVIDQATLDAYKGRKPGRFNQLKEISRSRPFPPIVVAYYGSVLDAATLQKFKQGLLNAGSKEKGEMLLTLSHLSAFESVPPDFDRVIAETLKAYPKEP